MKSWVESANVPDCDFPLENLPYGVFRHQGRTGIGVAIGDQVLDVRGCVQKGLLSSLSEEVRDACVQEKLNALMSLGPASWSALRRLITELLSADSSAEGMRTKAAVPIIPMRDVQMQLPSQIGDYTDFYASIHHATRVGILFRPDNPLLPNYKYLPIGYHGRASSVVVSGTEIRRPRGQTKPANSPAPVFGLSRTLDYELEAGIFVGPGNALGEPIPIDDAEEHIFGVCLVNDWSARDIQSWEYQPLGPFLGKSFATSVSPWVVTMEALAPYRVSGAERSSEDPELLPYLVSKKADAARLDVTVEVLLQSEQMRMLGAEPVQLSRGNLRDLYWSLGQLVAHHTSNGCNFRPGDLLATGTISGPQEGSEGCLLEMKHRSEPITLPTGETRTFLEDGDEVILRGYCQRQGLPRIGFGECAGRIVPTSD
jgi:fumarylacetoacetase